MIFLQKAQNFDCKLIRKIYPKLDFLNDFKVPNNTFETSFAKI